MKPADIIYHTTTTNPTFKNRLKLLFGASLRVNSEIGIDKEVNVLYSKGTDTVTFERKGDSDE